MSQYESFSRDISARVDFSNYATKIDIKNITHIDTLKTNLARLETEIVNWILTS